MKNLFKRLRKQTAGVILMEYVILGFLVAAMSIAAVGTFGKTISNDFITLSVASMGDGQGTLDAATANLNAFISATTDIDKHTEQIGWYSEGGGVHEGFTAATVADYQWNGLKTFDR